MLPADSVVAGLKRVLVWPKGAPGFGGAAFPIFRLSRYPTGQMSCLSVFDQGVFVVCANPIFPTSEVEWRDGASFSFEVFVADATSLRLRLNEDHYYAMDSQACLARLTSLDPCRSTHPGLRFLRDKPTLRGTMMIVRVGAPAST